MHILNQRLEFIFMNLKENVYKKVKATLLQNCTTENVENGHFDLETVKEGMNATIMCDPGYQNRKPVRMCRDSKLRPLKKYHPYHCKKGENA